MNTDALLDQVDTRSREIFRRIVDSYLETGEPLGSRNISRMLENALSPASIRNVMSDLEHMGLIYAPHTSAGRMPTELGLRFFIDSLMEVGDLNNHERAAIDARIANENSMETVLSEASQMLSGLSHGAGVVLAHKQEKPLKHIEFVQLDKTRALAVLVGEDNQVENRILEIAPGITQSALTEAANYLNAHLRGFTLQEARRSLGEHIGTAQRELDELSSKVVEAGLASWVQTDSETPPTLIVRGRSNLLDNTSEEADFERLRLLFDELESKRDLANLLGLAEEADGVRIFIGSENKLFSLSGSSVVLSPYKDADQNVVGVIGVIGPTRLNYARVVPVVDYTAQLVSQILR